MSKARVNRCLPLWIWAVLTACGDRPERVSPPLDLDRLPWAEPRFSIVNEPSSSSPGSIQVDGLPASLLKALRDAGLSQDELGRFMVVRTPDAATQVGMPAVVGVYSLDSTSIRFHPRFPLKEGLAYQVRLDPRGLDPAASQPATVGTVALPFHQSAAPPPQIVALYPTAGALPANQLKMYVHFSHPMRVGDAYARLRLLDETTGQTVPHAFVESGRELWDPDQKRFTLLFNPGRIKRGLRGNVERGVPLLPGGRYRLVVEPGWRDAAGRALTDRVEKAFRVYPADRARPNPDDWEIDVPVAGSRRPLTVRFPEPMDHALLSRVLAVRELRRGQRTGRIEVGAEERSWSFYPDSPWFHGDYHIQVGAVLEDLAGNNLHRLFDVDGETTSATDDRPTVVTIPFQIPR